MKRKNTRVLCEVEWRMAVANLIERRHRPGRARVRRAGSGPLNFFALSLSSLPPSSLFDAVAGCTARFFRQCSPLKHSLPLRVAQR